MRSLDEAKSRWHETMRHAGSPGELQRAIKHHGPDSPCVSGCRSVCWKIFLLFQGAPSSAWQDLLDESRQTYSAYKAAYLKYIDHPEELADVVLDPLTDDPDSPWNTVRTDDVIREEILQDVRRLPDEPFYHDERTQRAILDILFIYCKANPNSGGYRQGMHELLAPMFYVVDHDAIDRMDNADPSLEAMFAMLDRRFVEHDAFALFTKIMTTAREFYEVSDQPADLMPMSLTPEPTKSSKIVERSRHIHEILLFKVDPELSTHLKAIEILPQIFLIRWIRLLFGREFPFAQLLGLWDSLFALDPSLELVDLICVAMLIRIRWSLLEADYSVALQLLLKYPAPNENHGPHTFVQDAVYLRDHCNAAGGASLCLKYTGRTPSTSASSSRPSSPGFRGLSLRQRARGTRSPLASPARFIQSQPSVEALFHGAAKGVLERGEKLGINQAVRDAMGELKRNMQGLNDARNAIRGAGSASSSHIPARSTLEMERRNRQLAGILDETLAALKELASPGSADDTAGRINKLEDVIAKVQLVKLCLEDSSIAVPDLGGGGGSRQDASTDLVIVDAPPDSAVTKQVAAHSASPPQVAVTLDRLADLSMSDDAPPPPAVSPQPASVGIPVARAPQSDQILVAAGSPSVETPSPPAPEAQSSSVPATVGTAGLSSSSSSSSIPPATEATAVPPSSSLQPPPAATTRPKAPIPTRSTIAQSSFSWMLEPDETSSSITSTPRGSSPSTGFGSPQVSNHHRRTNPSRERNAFLFGEVLPDECGGGGAGAGARPADDIFGLQVLPKRKGGSTGG